MKRRIRITKLSPSTGDYGAIVKEFLRSVGHSKRQVDATPVFTVRLYRVVVGAFGTLEEAESFASRIPVNAKEPRLSNQLVAVRNAAAL